MLVTIRELKTAKAWHHAPALPALCARLHRAISDDLAAISEARGERAELLADFGSHDGWEA